MSSQGCCIYSSKRINHKNILTYNYINLQVKLSQTNCTYLDIPEFNDPAAPFAADVNDENVELQNPLKDDVPSSADDSIPSVRAAVEFGWLFAYDFQSATNDGSLSGTEPFSQPVNPCIAIK